MVFATGLRRIARINGAAETARGWRHFSVDRRCNFLWDLATHSEHIVPAERRLRRIRQGAILAALILTLAGMGFLYLARTSGPDNEENPASPENLRPGVYRLIVRLVDRDQMDLVAFRSPEFERHPDAAADLDQGGLPGLRGDVAAADHDISIEYPRGHAVAVDAQGERAARQGGEAGKIDVLDHALGGGRG
jgi:hypothetical protein